MFERVGKNIDDSSIEETITTKYRNIINKA